MATPKAQTPAKTPDVQPQTPDAKQTPEAPKTPEATVKPEEVYESENLTKLRAQESDLTDKLFAAGKTPEGKKIMLELWTIGQSIENEISAIKKERLRLDAEIKRNAIAADFYKMFDLYDAKKTADANATNFAGDRMNADGTTSEVFKPLLDAANAAEVAFKNAVEPHLNRALGSAPRATTTATPTANGNGSKGKTTEEIRNIIAPLYATMTPAQIRAHVIKELKYNDGTANAVIVAYERENHLNGK